MKASDRVAPRDPRLSQPPVCAVSHVGPAPPLSPRPPAMTPSAMQMPTPGVPPLHPLAKPGHIRPGRHGLGRALPPAPQIHPARCPEYPAGLPSFAVPPRPSDMPLELPLKQPPVVNVAFVAADP